MLFIYLDSYDQLITKSLSNYGGFKYESNIWRHKMHFEAAVQTAQYGQQATLLIGQYLFSEEMSGVDMNMQKKSRYNYQEEDGSFLSTEFR